MKLTDILCSVGAAEAALINYQDCRISNPRLASKLGFEPKTVCIGLIPYYTHACERARTVSTYALAYDYHLLIEQMGKEAVSRARTLYPNQSFQFFGDHSPICEKDAAAKAGLGLIGDHSLLITPRYSSFVFLFEILTDLECDVKSQEIKYCEHCGACLRACPTFLSGNGECVSSISQKKGELTPEEESFILKCGTVWGCDICQLVCPHTQNAIKAGTIYSDLDWFNYNIITSPTQDSISDSEDFSRRAYSWRGPNTILRNISILNNKRRN